MRRLISIQCLRFAAASAVVLTHCASGKLMFGAFGVDIFFVISGFIITKVMERRDAAAFIKDRFSRIYPIYWVCLVPMLIINWDSDAWRLLTSLTLWPVFGHFRRSFLEVGWTLHFEMLFYLAATVVLWRRAMLPILLLAYGAALAFGLVTGEPVLDFLGSPMVLEFLMGVGIALLPATSFRVAGALLVAVGLGAAIWGADIDFGIIENMFNGVSAWRWAAWGIPAAMIVWGTMQFEGHMKGFIFQFGAAGGDASYALYLSHPVFLMLKPANPYVLAALGPPVLIGLGFAVHHWVEKPLLRWVRSILARTKRAKPVAHSVQESLVDP